MWSDGRDIFEGAGGGGRESKAQKSFYSGLPFVQTKEERIFLREKEIQLLVYTGSLERQSSY